MLKVGMFIQNRYEIISRIGSGGMADVYKAKDHKLNRFVAVKVLKKEFREDKAFISKFKVEAQSAAGLAHANIVNIYDTGEEAGIYYIVMELVEGITLKEYIEKKGRLSVRETTSIALQISAGLEAAHNNGIIHRDVKPQNIMISTDGRVKVADFGIARASTSNTINSSAMGSVHYSSPEQARGGYSDEKSDIYSLGITMFEMLTGHVPFDGDTAVAVAIKHLQEEMTGPGELVLDIPVSTNQIVMKCTQKSPSRRYNNMTELIRDLRESLVNPDGNFVTQQEPDRKSQTIIMSKEEIHQINAERNMPVYDTTANTGAFQELQEQENQGEKQRAYQPGSYYQQSTYQEVNPQGKQEDDNYDPYYDKYDNSSDYGFRQGDYRIEEGYTHKKRHEEEDDSEIGLNPRLEKAVTVGGIIVAVVIGCVFLSLLANAFGLFRIGSKKKDSETQKDAIVVEKDTETGETETQKETEKNPVEILDQEEADFVNVPDLRGNTEEAAKQMLEEKGFQGMCSGEVSSDQYPAGTICSQDPEAGALTDVGKTISYQISTGKEGMVLSDLSGQEQSQAQAYLLTQGLTAAVEMRYSDSVPEGYVIETSPAAEETVQEGDTITLYVSQGPEQEVTYVTVPDVYYCDEDISSQRCVLYGLGEPVFEYEASSSVNKGFVIRQSIEADTQVPAGTVLTLTVSTGPSSSQDVTIQNEGQGTWQCSASLDTPAGYQGQNVRIDLVQDGVTTTVASGQVTFPYLLQVQGKPGVTTGSAYVYLLNDAGETESTIEYPGITFSQVN